MNYMRDIKSRRVDKTTAVSARENHILRNATSPELSTLNPIVGRKEVLFYSSAHPGILTPEMASSLGT